jgi:hypothetical protein
MFKNFDDSAATFKVTIDDPDHVDMSPVKNRGLNFTGTDTTLAPRIAVDATGLILNHSFAIHSWIYLPTLTSTESYTIFSKDRNDFSADNLAHLFRVSVEDDGKLQAEMTLDTDANTVEA